MAGGEGDGAAKPGDLRRAPDLETTHPGGHVHLPVKPRELGYSIKITFHRATDVPVADFWFQEAPCDPYMVADLVAHDLATLEDPDEKQTVRWRTKTIYKSLDPTWEEYWLVENVPAAGNELVCRLYDEDVLGKDDRLGNVKLELPPFTSEAWKEPIEFKKKVSKRAAAVKIQMLGKLVAKMHKRPNDTYLFLTIECLGRTKTRETLGEREGGRMFAAGPTWMRQHKSPMLGFIAGTRNPTGSDGSDGHVPLDNDDVQENEGPRSAPPPTRSLLEGTAEAMGSLRPHSAALTTSNRTDSKSKSGAEKKGMVPTTLDFPAYEFQLAGPVPHSLCHRYVSDRVGIAMMFTGSGLRGLFASRVAHDQHGWIYGFNRSTKYHVFPEHDRNSSVTTETTPTDGPTQRSGTRQVEPDGQLGRSLLSPKSPRSPTTSTGILSPGFRRHSRSNSAASSGTTHPSPPTTLTEAFLRACQLGRGGRVFTYVIMLDGLMRFTETGPEFRIDSLSKHTLHSDVTKFIAYSGEFFVQERSNLDQVKQDKIADPEDSKKKHSTSPSQSSSRKAGKQSTHRPEDHEQVEAESSHPIDERDSRGTSEYDAGRYELVIDNESGTYQPDGKLLSDLQTYLSNSFPDLHIVTLDTSSESEKSHIMALKHARKMIKSKSSSSTFYVRPRRVRKTDDGGFVPTIDDSDQSDYEQMATSQWLPKTRAYFRHAGIKSVKVESSDEDEDGRGHKRFIARARRARKMMRRRESLKTDRQDGSSPRVVVDRPAS